MLASNLKLVMEYQITYVSRKFWTEKVVHMSVLVCKLESVWLRVRHSRNGAAIIETNSRIDKILSSCHGPRPEMDINRIDIKKLDRGLEARNPDELR